MVILFVYSLLVVAPVAFALCVWPLFCGPFEGGEAAVVNSLFVVAPIVYMGFVLFCSALCSF